MLWHWFSRVKTGCTDLRERRREKVCLEVWFKVLLSPDDDDVTSDGRLFHVLAASIYVAAIRGLINITDPTDMFLYDGRRDCAGARQCGPKHRQKSTVRRWTDRISETNRPTEKLKLNAFSNQKKSSMECKYWAWHMPQQMTDGQYLKSAARI